MGNDEGQYPGRARRGFRLDKANGDEANCNAYAAAGC
jgi:hypothetical protein